MVSTRSQSLVSNSSLQTGQGKGDLLGEVTSKDPATTPRTTRRSRQQHNSSLEAIAEEPAPRTTRKNSKSKSQEAPADAVDEKLVDRIADNIFAALEDAFGSGSDAEESASDSSESEDVEEVGPSIRERQLHWKPALSLPGTAEKKAKSRGAGLSSLAEPSSDLDALLEGKSGNLAKQLHVPPADSRKLLRAARKNAPDTAGKAWFDLPATQITDEVKNDLRVLRLRSALDPKAFYKKFDTTKFPKYFQFGTVIEGPTEFYSSRLTRKERKRTLTEEIMADPHLTQVRKKRYNKMQEEAARWAAKPSRKTGNARLKKKPQRPKH